VAVTVTLGCGIPGLSRPLRVGIGAHPGERVGRGWLLRAARRPALGLRPRLAPPEAGGDAPEGPTA